MAQSGDKPGETRSIDDSESIFPTEILAPVALLILLLFSSFFVHSSFSDGDFEDVEGVVTIEFTYTINNGTYSESPRIEGPLETIFDTSNFRFYLGITLLNPYDAKIEHTYGDGCLGEVEIDYQGENPSNQINRIQECLTEPRSITLEPGFNYYQTTVIYGWDDVDLTELPRGKYVFTFDPEIAAVDPNARTLERTVLTLEDEGYELQEASLSHFDFNSWWFSMLLSANFAILLYIVLKNRKDRRHKS